MIEPYFCLGPNPNRRKNSLHGTALVSVNKALVTQASAAIPVVPLYLSLLIKIMKEKGTEEGCIEQMHRLFTQNIYANSALLLDSEGRLRLDDLEMQEDVQQQIEEIWPQLCSANLHQLADVESYCNEFLRLFGFGPRQK